MPEPPPTADRSQLRLERERLLRQLATALDRPMTALAFVWLGLLVLDAVALLPPALGCSGRSARSGCCGPRGRPGGPGCSGWSRP